MPKRRVTVVLPSSVINGEREAGLAMCHMKKVLGSSRAFNDILKFADPDGGDQVYLPTIPRK